MRSETRKRVAGCKLAKPFAFLTERHRFAPQGRGNEHGANIRAKGESSAGRTPLPAGSPARSWQRTRGEHSGQRARAAQGERLCPQGRPQGRGNEHGANIRGKGREQRRANAFARRVSRKAFFGLFLVKTPKNV
ncbi:hypothetical protein CTM58_00695 [Prevotella intermedia]|uniref:Uncharacterized protein n=1 Tax=Prevotella intermedia TaxID=28131 RepID=A0A2M8TS36_PREIN|nr:hypothetical protein CTM58_00695 [Prevotella intermedia]